VDGGDEGVEFEFELVASSDTGGYCTMVRTKRKSKLNPISTVTMLYAKKSARKMEWSRLGWFLIWFRNQSIKSVVFLSQFTGLLFPKFS